MAARKTLLKVLFSATAAVVLLASVYFLLGSDVRGYRGLLVNREELGYSGFLRDLVGRSVELDKQSLAELLATSLERRIVAERSKIDFLIEQMSDEDVDDTDEPRTSSDILGFVETHPLIEEALLINARYEVVLSTADDARIGTVLDRDVYRDVFTSDGYGEVVDEAINSIVFYRKVQSGHALLFFYGTDFIRSVFSDVPGFLFTRAILTSDRVVLINFPVVNEDDRENLRNLSRAVFDQKSGFIRIRRDELDKTIYFVPLSQTSQTWIVAVTYDTAQLRISHIGVLILVIQAAVVAAIIIFILTTVNERKKLRLGLLPSHDRQSNEIRDTARIEEAVEQTDQQKLQYNDVVQSTTEALSERDDVISLDDVEEVRDIQEVGEAEIAQEYHEYDEQQTVPDAQEIGDAEGETEPDSDTVTPLEAVEQDKHEHVEMQSQALNDTSELQKLEAVQREIMGPDAQMLEEIEELEAIELGEQGDGGFEEEEQGDLSDEDREEIPFDDLEETDMDLEDVTLELTRDVNADDFDLDGASGDNASDVATTDEGQAVDIPNLEALVGAGATSDSDHVREESDGVLETDFITSEQDRSAATAELEEDSEGSSIRDRFSKFLQNVGIQKGAVLLKQSTGIYKPLVVTGFSRDTEPKLIFSGKEKIVSRVLMRDKILHIRNNVFMDDELGTKFSRTDTSSIDSVYFAPLMPSGSDLAGFIVLGPTPDEPGDSPEVLKKIKEIKKSLTNIL